MPRQEEVLAGHFLRSGAFGPLENRHCEELTRSANLKQSLSNEVHPHETDTPSYKVEPKSRLRVVG